MAEETVSQAHALGGGCAHCAILQILAEAGLQEGSAAPPGKRHMTCVGAIIAIMSLVIKDIICKLDSDEEAEQAMRILLRNTFEAILEDDHKRGTNIAGVFGFKVVGVETMADGTETRQ